MIGIIALVFAGTSCFLAYILKQRCQNLINKYGETARELWRLGFKVDQFFSNSEIPQIKDKLNSLATSLDKQKEYLNSFLKKQKDKKTSLQEQINRNNEEIERNQQEVEARKQQSTSYFKLLGKLDQGEVIDNNEIDNLPANQITDSEKDRLKKRNQKNQQKADLQRDIRDLENKPNKTKEEEAELDRKKKELEKLDDRSSSEKDSNKNSWIKPALIGGTVLVIGLIICLLNIKNKKLTNLSQ